MSFVVVLPVAPVIPTTWALVRSRTRPAIAASAVCASSGTSVAAAPRASAWATKSAPPPPTATNRSPSSIRRESICRPVTSEAQGRAVRRPRGSISVELERDHGRAAARRSASRATSRSSKGTFPEASSCSGSAPRPAITTMSPARGLGERQLDRGAAVELHARAAERRPPRLPRRSRPGASERGLSEVRIARSASSRDDAAHQRPLAAIAVAAGAEHDLSCRRRGPRAVRITFSSESGVCA